MSAHRRLALGLLGLGAFMLAGCALLPTERPDARSSESLLESKTGRFVLTGSALGQPIQGRYEWARSAQSEWVVLMDPWGNALGEVSRARVSVGSASALVIRDQTGRVLQSREASAWLQAQFGLSEDQLEEQVTDAMAGFGQSGPARRSIRLTGAGGSLSLEIMAERPEGARP